MRRNALSLSAAAVLALSLSACSTGAETEADGSTEAAGASTSATTPAGSSTSAATEAPASEEMTTASAEASESESSEPAESESGSTEPSPTEAADDGKLVFGDTYTWPDGLSITIGEPEEFTPTESAAGAEGEGTPLKFEVTVENGTDQPVPAGLISMQSASGGAEDEMIIDSEGDILPASVDIRPGKTLSWTAAYMVADPSDQAIQVSNMNDFTSDSVYFDVE